MCVLKWLQVLECGIEGDREYEVWLAALSGWREAEQDDEVCLSNKYCPSAPPSLHHWQWQVGGTLGVFPNPPRRAFSAFLGLLNQGDPLEWQSRGAG